MTVRVPAVRFMAISLPTEQLSRSRDASALIVVNAESRQPFRKPLGPAGFGASPDLDEAPRPQDASDYDDPYIAIRPDETSSRPETPVAGGIRGEGLRPS